MASSIISRLLPSTSDGQPEGAHNAEDRGDDASLSSRRPKTNGGLSEAVDDENLGEHFEDQDLDALLQDAAHSEMGTESAALPQDEAPAVAYRSSGAPPRGHRPDWMQKRMPPPPSEIDEDDDVPESLLLDPGARKQGKGRPRRKSRGGQLDELPPPVPGTASRATRKQWRSTKTHQRLHNDTEGGPPQPLQEQAAGNALLIADPRDKAMWKWANVQNLDVFLAEVYEYYEQNGIWSILLKRALNHISLAFVIGFSTFLTQCVDYADLPKRNKLSEIIVPQCTRNMGAGWNFLLWLVAVWWVYMLIQWLIDIPRLWELHNFYHHLLGIPDSDIQTVSWQLVVGKLMALRDANAATVQDMSPEARRFVAVNSKQRMDAHDIANRLMRKENYMIALINRDAFDTSVPIPFVGNVQFWTRNIEWNINLALMDYLFDEQGQLKKEFLASRNRRKQIEALRARFFYVGVINIFYAPFFFIYYMVTYFFTYFAEFRSDPGQLGSRAFTPLAELKFREFNELFHLFQQRKRMAYPFATQYLAQFPKDKIEQLARFTAFVTGALAAVLGLCSLFDPELFLGFEITPGKNVLFWLGVLGTIYATARAQVPNHEDVALDPWLAMAHVIEWTHYYPDHWHERLHSDEVRKEFTALFKPKIAIFLEEALSMIFAPYVLCISLPNCAEQLIDFFREFTVHIDGLGHVCSFAEFDFSRPNKLSQPKRDRNGQPLAQQDVAAAVNQDFYTQGQQKQALSQSFFLNAYAQNPGYGTKSGRRNWVPPPHFGTMMPLSPTQTHLAHHGAQNDAGGMGLGMGMSQVGSRTVAGGGAGGLGAMAAAMRQSTHHTRTPRMGPQAHESQVQSVLLDPHNQPSAGVLHSARSPRQAAIAGPSRLRAMRHPLAHGPDEGAEKGLDRARQTTSRILEEDSMLGDSWRTNEAATVDEGLLDEAGPTRPEGDAGVLGMLLNFQKAHAEGRGVGI